MSTEYYNSATQTCEGKLTLLQKIIKAISSKNVIPVAQLAQDRPQINAQAVQLISTYRSSNVFHVQSDNFQQMVKTVKVIFSKILTSYCSTLLSL